MDIFVPGNGDLGPCGTALCPTFTNWTTNRATTEETQSAYIQINASTELGDFPVDMRLGLRYEQTDVTSRAEVPAYNTIVWVGGNELVPTTDGDAQFTTLEGDYDYLLPNFDVAVDFTDELVARFSYSETLTRPNYVDIQGGVTIDSPVRIDSGTGSRGNPALLPFESDNIDLSVEYYYADASYASIGYFRKDVKNFIGRDTVAETVFDLPHPGLGPLADEARQAGVAPNDILNWILTNRSDAEGVDVDAGTVTGIAGRDPSAVFDLNIPVNIDEATVDGWELNVQHDFWETGFGVIVNATFVDGDVGYDDDSIGAQFALSGLSDSANFIGYYENDTLGVRLAYNWRDTFWAGNGQENVGGDHPTYVDEYGQWDLNASYWATDNLQLFVDVINLTDETAYVYGRQKDQPLFAVQQGTRYNIGVRYKF
jgi:TonB-dependent receptor